MEIKILNINEKQIAEIISDDVIISTVEDAIDILGNSNYHGAEAVILRKEQITENFFVLKTGFAGEILQKFSNYNMKLAVIGDFSNIKSKSFTDFIYESNKAGHINFVFSKEEAIKKLNR